MVVAYRATPHPEDPMFAKKTLVTAAITATALMSPAAALASGGSNSKSKSSTSSSAPSVAECAQIANVNTTVQPRLDWPGHFSADVHAQVVNCGTQTESLAELGNLLNLTSGIQEYNGVFRTPQDVPPGGSYDIWYGDAATTTVSGNSYEWHFTVKSGTTDKTLSTLTVPYSIP